ncbi:unnamed protein product [Soboliphyme baturini]|uniref:EGF-like domain-containing protein n=1 Tax=Soboliphyme baturini TaxID=241478 RepID=A0A183IQM3_9BILA|nr:unnamed protein product [Soboliphyme baturini]
MGLNSAHANVQSRFHRWLCPGPNNVNYYYNGGTCKVLSYDGDRIEYSCDCPEGYYGERCRYTEQSSAPVTDPDSNNAIVIAVVILTVLLIIALLLAAAVHSRRPPRSETVAEPPNI